MDHPTDTSEVLQKAMAGDATAVNELFARFEDQVRSLVAWRLDPQLAARLDVSDVVQDTFLVAARRFDDFVASSREIPFPLWLKMIARDRVIDVHRQHLLADCRTVSRQHTCLPQQSSVALANVLFDRGPTPSHLSAKREIGELMNQAISMLADDDREIIMWRHFEHLSIRETAQLLKISEAAASKRYVRALEKLKRNLQQYGLAGDSGPGGAS